MLLKAKAGSSSLDNALLCRPQLLLGMEAKEWWLVLYSATSKHRSLYSLEISSGERESQPNAQLRSCQAAEGSIP